MGRILFLDASFERPFVVYDETLLEVKTDAMAEVVAGLGRFEVVAVGSGPGSYTGMRVACSLGSALSLAWGVPLVSVSALLGFEEEGRVMLDARSGGVYLVEEGVPLKKSLQDLDYEDVVISPVAGPLRSRLPEETQVVEAMPDPRRLCKLVEEKLARGEYSREGQAALIYLGRTL